MNTGIVNANEAYFGLRNHLNSQYIAGKTKIIQYKTLINSSLPYAQWAREETDNHRVVRYARRGWSCKDHQARLQWTGFVNRMTRRTVHRTRAIERLWLRWEDCLSRSKPYQPWYTNYHRCDKTYHYLCNKWEQEDYLTLYFPYWADVIETVRYFTMVKHVVYESLHLGLAEGYNRQRTWFHNAYVIILPLKITILNS